MCFQQTKTQQCGVDKFETKHKTKGFVQNKQTKKYLRKSNMKISKLILLSHTETFHVKLSKKIIITSSRTWQIENFITNLKTHDTCCKLGHRMRCNRKSINGLVYIICIQEWQKPTIQENIFARGEEAASGSLELIKYACATNAKTFFEMSSLEEKRQPLDVLN